MPFVRIGAGQKGEEERGEVVGVVNEEQGQRSHFLSLGSNALKLLFKQRLCLGRSRSSLPAPGPAGYQKSLQTSVGFFLVL